MIVLLGNSRFSIKQYPFYDDLVTTKVFVWLPIWIVWLEFLLVTKCVSGVSFLMGIEFFN